MATPKASLTKQIRITSIGLLILLIGLLIMLVVAYREHLTVVRDQSSIRSLTVSNNPNGIIPNFQHIFLIMEENDSDNKIIGNPEASFMNALASDYSLATNYHGVTHPSLPNYLAITSGSTHGIESDCLPVGGLGSCPVNAPNLVDEIEQSGRTWKAYYESMPQPCSVTSTDLYSVNMDPFVYYKDIVDNKQRCDSHVVPFSQLSTDLASPNQTAVPNFAFIVPNKCDDAHSCPVTVSDKWLSSTATELLDSPVFTNQNSLLIITWDESDLQSQTNNVPLILVGSQVKKSYQSAKDYNHYSVLHTIERAWNLNPLTKLDSKAPTLQEFFVYNH